MLKPCRSAVLAKGKRRLAKGSGVAGKREAAVGTADSCPPQAPTRPLGRPSAKAFRKAVSDLQKGKRGRLLGALCLEVEGLFQRWSAKGRRSGNGVSPRATGLSQKS